MTALPTQPISDPIAAVQIDGVQKDQTTISISFFVGKPYRNEESAVEEWRCAVSLQPLYSRLAHATGGDSMQALCLAISLGLDLLGKFVEDASSHRRDRSLFNHMRLATPFALRKSGLTSPPHAAQITA